MEAAALPALPGADIEAPKPRADGQLILGVFADLDEVIDTTLAMGALLGLFLSYGLGSIGVVGFLGCVGLLSIRAPGDVAKSVVNSWAVMLLPVFALTSVAWSTIPSESLRASVQLLITFFGAVVLATRVNQRQFVLALMFAALLTAVGCLASPRVHAGPEGVAFVGLMGSKNQMSFLAGTLVLASLTVMLDPKHLKLVRLAAIPTALFGVALVYSAKSAGGTIGVAAGTGILLVGVVVARMRFLARVFLLGAALIISAPAIAMAPTLQDAGEDFIVNVLHKDTTLTGRTYLWDKGLAISAERPMLGLGYHAFWVRGQADAEGLWAWADIKTRAGFNFHNQYVDILVTLGWIGVAVLVLSLFYTTLSVGMQALLAPSVAGAFFLSNTLVQVMRTTTESALAVEFNFYTLMFFAGGVMAWKAMKGVKPNARPISRRGNPRPERPGVDRGRRAPTRLTRRYQEGPELS